MKRKLKNDVDLVGMKLHVVIGMLRENKVIDAFLLLDDLSKIMDYHRYSEIKIPDVNL